MMPFHEDDDEYVAEPATPRSLPGGMRQPYGDLPGMSQDGPLPMGEGASVAERAMQNLASLPPEMQAMVKGALGADPMVASAFLAVLGPQFEPLIREAMRENAPMAQPPPAGMQQPLAGQMSAQPGIGAIKQQVG